MPALPEPLGSRTELTPADLAWLSRLQADWQIIADLSFADLVLWVPDRDGSGFWALGQMRPTTGPTALVDDVVGTFLPAGARMLLDVALEEGRIARDGDPEWRDDVPVRVEAIPVLRRGRGKDRDGDRVIAVVARNTNLQGVRTPSRLELSYLQTAGELTQMIANGSFPFAGERSDHTDSPRVGDGFLRLDEVGAVTYASPNALSVYRKLGLRGDLAGQHLSSITRSLVPPQLRVDEETLSAVLGARMPRDTELTTGTATVVLRSIPLRPAGTRTGGLVLLRDVTELRSRERELITKDATIREIHHRVKNNLQTVAALLRLQARRMGDGAGREALEEAVRRVGAIAVVHETLSQTFEEAVAFDAVADQLLALVSEVGSREEPVVVRRTGTFGTVSSDIATPLAMVLTELVQNSLEHGYPEGRGGEITVAVETDARQLQVQVVDDGVGLPEHFDLAASSSLGLSIVRTLVGELGGTIRFEPAGRGTGTRVELQLPVTWRGDA
ncbi:MAG TPA: sensor histidine kinase [Marmoricola sp.]|nr:sensor histidine kinase [Marmoricola sp.]